LHWEPKRTPSIALGVKKKKGEEEKIEIGGCRK